MLNAAFLTMCSANPDVLPPMAAQLSRTAVPPPGAALPKAALPTDANWPVLRPAATRTVSHNAAAATAAVEPAAVSSDNAITSECTVCLPVRYAPAADAAFMTAGEARR